MDWTYVDNKKPEIKEGQIFTKEHRPPCSYHTAFQDEEIYFAIISNIPFRSKASEFK